MPSLEVLSRTQRIVVLPNTSVSIVKEGPPGPQGIQGLLGAQGPAGIDGEDGVSPEVLQYEPATLYIEGDKGVMILGIDDSGNYSGVLTEAGALKVAGDFSSDGLTDDELRATPVSVGLDAISLAALENVSVSGTVTVQTTLGTLSVADNNLAALIRVEDTVVSSAGPGIAMLVERHDSNSSSVSADGDYSLLHVDATGHLKVVGPVTDAQLRATPVPISGTVALDSTTLSALENTTVTIDAGSLAALETINVANIAGTEFVEDVAAVSGDKGTFILGVRHDADTATVGTDGDYSALHTDSAGKLKVAGPLTDAQLRATPIAVTGAGGGVQFAEDVAAANGDLGTFILAMRHDADTATVGTDGDYSALHTDASGKLKVTGGTSPATTGTASNVTNAIADTSVLALNANRKGASIFNDDTANTGAVVNIALGFTASATAFTVKLPPQGLYELPSNYTGTVRAYSSAATGTLRVTELT